MDEFECSSTTTAIFETIIYRFFFFHIFFYSDEFTAKKKTLSNACSTLAEIKFCRVHGFIDHFFLSPARILIIMYTLPFFFFLFSAHPPTVNRRDIFGQQYDIIRTRILFPGFEHLSFRHFSKLSSKRKKKRKDKQNE